MARSAMDTLTPMLRQYRAIKAQHPDAILMFRLGDFYEMFYDDALLASKTLSLTLTSRGRGTKNEAPMCGVPYHAADGYVARLIRHGYRVADQARDVPVRSEEHTSELQSRPHLVCRLLLVKKKSKLAAATF